MERSEISSEVVSPTASNAAAPKRPVSLIDQMNLNAFWIANNFHWQALLAIVIPSMVVKFLGNADKDINLALVVIWGTIVAIIVNPLVGALSDYATFRMGRRRPFLIIGTLFNVIPLIIFAFAPSWFSSTALLITFSILFLFLQLTNNFANAPWGAIIADNVPPNQRGLTSGFAGLFTLLGTVLGAIVAGLIVNKNDTLPIYRHEIVQIFLLVAVVQIIFVIYTVLTVKETPLPITAKFELRPAIKRFLFHPADYPDLSWVLLARLLIMLGIWMVFYFLQYYFDDVLGGPGVKTILFGSAFSGEKFNGTLFQPVLLLAALPTSMIAGWMSDHYGRKRFVYLSGAVMSIVCLIFIIAPSQGLILLGAAFFGISYGAYSSVDWALTCDVLPPTDEAGKFLGIWTAMGIIPQAIGIVLGALILQALRGLPSHLGYKVLFVSTILFFALGTVIIKGVKGVK
jgi:MFS family permease